MGSNRDSEDEPGDTAASSGIPSGDYPQMLLTQGHQCLLELCLLPHPHPTLPTSSQMGR